MNQEQLERVLTLFDKVLEGPPVERENLVAKLAGEDALLLNELVRLLVAHQETEKEKFMESPAWSWQSPRIGHHSARTLIDDHAAHTDRPDQPFWPYRILREMNGGGMSRVFLAERADGAYNQQVVIKIAGGRLPDDERIRLRQERQILAGLAHDNIARFLYGDRTQDGQDYIVMEFAEGVSLREYLRQKQALPLDQVVAITRQVCAGLQAAHDYRVIHRDIKPENIMIDDRDGRLRVKLIDFGIAIPKDPKLAIARQETQGLIGSFHYIAPERIAARNRDEIEAASDIYSLGAVIYEMLTCRYAFDAETPTLLLASHQHDAPPPPGAVRPDLLIPAGVDQIVMKALEKSPAKRPASAAELARELALAVEYPSIATRIIETTAIRPRLARRRPLLILSLSCAMLLATGGLYAYKLLNTPPGDAGAEVQSAGPIQPQTQSQSMTAGKSSATATALQPATATAPKTEASSAAEIPKLRVSLLQITRSRTFAVSPDRSFRNGDAVRFAIDVPEAGYLYLVQRGSSGRVSILFPNPQIPGSDPDGAVPPGTLTFPSAGEFKFDKQTGVETVYILFASRRGAPVFSEIERAIRERRATLTASEANSLLAKLQERIGQSPAMPGPDGAIQILPQPPTSGGEARTFAGMITLKNQP
jgi:serine/threonine protein kinase